MLAPLIVGLHPNVEKAAVARKRIFQRAAVPARLGDFSGFREPGIVMRVDYDRLKWPRRDGLIWTHPRIRGASCDGLNWPHHTVGIIDSFPVVEGQG